MNRFNKSGGIADFLTNPIVLVLIGLAAISSWMKLRRLENVLSAQLTE